MMALDRKTIFEKAKEVTKKHNLFWIEDICAFIPMSKSTFYDYFPSGSSESNELKDLLGINRMELKVSMRKKWHESNAPALQMALMKLISNPEELRRLSMSHQVTEEAEKPIFNKIDLDIE